MTDDSLTEFDSLTDDQVLCRCATARRQMDLVRGTRLLGARRWSPRGQLAAFMGIFHPDYDKQKLNDLLLEQPRTRPGAHRYVD